MVLKTQARRMHVARMVLRHVTWKGEVVGQGAKRQRKLLGGTVIREKAGLNRQPIGQKGRATIPLGGVSLVVCSRAVTRFELVDRLFLPVCAMCCRLQVRPRPVGSQHGPSVLLVY